MVTICLPAKLTGAVENTNCISAEGYKYDTKRSDDDSSSGTLANVEYSFIAITPKPTQTWSGSTC